MVSVRDHCAIVGIGETDYSTNSGRSELRLALEAARRAIQDAGITPREIDGIGKFIVDNVPIPELAASLGLTHLRYYDELGPAGGAATGLIVHAVSAICTGMANYVLVFRAMNGRSGQRYGSGAITMQRGRGNSAFSEPYGLLVPGQGAALGARRYMHEFGARPEHFGAVAVAFRKHACMNPRAIMYGKPMTMQDYLNSRIVHDPLRLYDCCLETDGACAVIITTVERARGLPQRPVYIRAVAQALEGLGDRRTHVGATAARFLADALFRDADVKREDIDTVQIYEPFSPVVLYKLEDYGFCQRGEGGAFVEGGRIEVGGQLPVNTSGGHLSEAYLHGMNHIIEGVRQLRGQSTAQVPDAELALVDSGDGFGAMILRR